MPWCVSGLRFHLYKEEPKIFYLSQKYRTHTLLAHSVFPDYRLQLFVFTVVVVLHSVCFTFFGRSVEIVTPFTALLRSIGLAPNLGFVKTSVPF